MAAYPGSLASFTGFTSSHTLAADSHAAQHNLEQGEIVAVQTKVGTGSSTPTSAKLLRGTGVGTSLWAQADLTTDVTGILPQTNGGTGTTSSTGTGAVVYQTSPTLTTPAIASFTSAQHNHTNAAGGGQLGAGVFTTGAIAGADLSTSAIFLGYAEITASQGGITTVTDITGLTVTVTVPAGGRRVEIIGWAPQIFSTVDADRADWQILEGATVLNTSYGTAHLTGNGWGGPTVIKNFVPSAGNHTYKMALTRGNGTGSLTVFSDASTGQASISVKLV